MSIPQSLSRKSAVVRVVCVVAVAAVLAELTISRETVLIIAEGLLLAGLFSLLVLPGTCRRAWDGMPGPYRALSLFLMFGLVFGQLAHNKRGTFPFISFNMYARSEAYPPVGVIVIGNAADGSKVPVSPAQLYPNLSHNRMANFVSHLVGRVYGTKIEMDVEEHEAAVDKLGQFSKALVRAHNLRNPSQPIIGVFYEQVTYPLRSQGPAADSAHYLEVGYFDSKGVLR